MQFPSVAKLKTIEKFRERLDELEIDLPVESSTGPGRLKEQVELASGSLIGNRFCILPMEGWDGTTTGHPTDLTIRRWENFGRSGAKLIWGGEAVAVRPDGRANPNQLMINTETQGGLAKLRQRLLEIHREEFGADDDLFIGLQLTHSGRFARPNQKSVLEPRTAYRHPLLDEKFSVDSESAILSDDELKRMVDDFVEAARLASDIGYSFVDIKHCHGYLGHELLSGFDRTGEFGGSFENRTRFLRDVISGIRSVAPELQFGVRLSVFDFCPFQPGAARVGEAAVAGGYRFAFGGDGTGTGIELAEPFRFVKLLQELGIELICTTAGSPYYNPHIQRPASFPPSDGYLPPEDPLVGVARQLQVTRDLKEAFPETFFVGSGYTYLQDWLPAVARGAVEQGWVDSVGLGRMVLSYPELPADVIHSRPFQRKKVCRTFSDCTTAPRNGMVSGCYPLDPFYKARPERQQLLELKSASK